MKKIFPSTVIYFVTFKRYSLKVPTLLVVEKKLGEVTMRPTLAEVTKKPIKAPGYWHTF